MAQDRIAKIPIGGDTSKSHVMPRLEINIPMPAGAAVPARSPQPQQIPQPQPAKPAAAQSR